MTDFDPVPDAADEARERWRQQTDTFGRVYDVILGITDPTPVSEIAELAVCSPNAAKKHLERLAEMGIVRASDRTPPVEYARDDGFLEWREASRIAAELDVDEIIDRVEQLEAERDTYESRFGSTDPSTVSVFELDDHEAIHERMAAVSQWQRIERNFRLYELARQLAQNDGHLLPA